MGEAAKAFWLEEFISPSEPCDVSVLEEIFACADGQSEEDWKFGSD